MNDGMIFSVMAEMSIVALVPKSFVKEFCVVHSLWLIKPVYVLKLKMVELKIPIKNFVVSF